MNIVEQIRMLRVEAQDDVDPEVGKARDYLVQEITKQLKKAGVRVDRHRWEYPEWATMARHWEVGDGGLVLGINGYDQDPDYGGPGFVVGLVDEWDSWTDQEDVKYGKRNSPMQAARELARNVGWLIDELASLTGDDLADKIARRLDPVGLEYNSIWWGELDRRWKIGPFKYERSAEQAADIIGRMSEVKRVSVKRGKRIQGHWTVLVTPR